MDIIATTFDIAMFLSAGGDCVQGIARFPSKEYDENVLPESTPAREDANAMSQSSARAREAAALPTSRRPLRSSAETRPRPRGNRSVDRTQPDRRLSPRL